MSEPRDRTQNSIATEAADWYARLRAPDVSEMDAVRFRAWLAGDADRRREFESIDRFWNDLAGIEHSPEVRRTREQVAARKRRTGRAFTRTRWAIAATLLIVVGGTVLAWQQWYAGRFTTEIGEQRTVPLADGSIIVLNTDTELRVSYSDAQRGVELVRGQASFEVAKDASRPFIVTAGDVEVRAVGTVFDVYKAADRITVTLIEGKVAVRSGGETVDVTPGPALTTPAGGNPDAAVSGPAHAQLLAAAGEQLSYAASAGSVERAIADVPRVTAWRARKLDFSDTPLLEAIAEANRYSREQIVLRAPALEQARISGTFEAGKNELFAEGLQSYFRLDLQRSDDEIVLIAR